MSSSVSIANDVEAFFRRYNEAFNHENTDDYFACLSFPHTFMNGLRGMMSVGSTAELTPMHQFVMADFKRRGWAKTEIDAVQTWPVADNAALLLADVTRRKHDGSVLEKQRYLYTIRKDKDWKILTALEIAEPYTGPGGPRR